MGPLATGTGGGTGPAVPTAYDLHRATPRTTSATDAISPPNEPLDRMREYVARIGRGATRGRATSP